MLVTTLHKILLLVTSLQTVRLLLVTALLNVRLLWVTLVQNNLLLFVGQTNFKQTANVGEKKEIKLKNHCGQFCAEPVFLLWYFSCILTAILIKERLWKLLPSLEKYIWNLFSEKHRRSVFEHFILLNLDIVGIWLHKFILNWPNQIISAVRAALSGDPRPLEKAASILFQAAVYHDE